MLVSHQRAPLLGLTLDGSDDDYGGEGSDDHGSDGPTATLVLGGMTTLDPDQLVKRIRREWSIAAVAPAWSGREVACPGKADVVPYGRDAAHPVGRAEDGAGHG